MKNTASLIALTILIFGQTCGASVAQDQMLPRYVSVKLTTDLSHTSTQDRQLLKLLIEAGNEMDAVFWQQAYGDKTKLLSSIADEKLKQHAMINYGPWERLQDNRPFIDGVSTKSKGANFYPSDITAEEFENT